MKNEMEVKSGVLFGNDMSRIVRGIAIILMVMGHSLPGKIIGFAVPLFTFLVGYGYAFAKQHTLGNSFKRIWHLLFSYWIVLLCVCLPAALISYPRPIPLSEIGLCLFGLNGRLNFFSWYVYFYIFTMLCLPAASRVIDRYGFKGAIILCAVCGGVVLAILGVPDYDANIFLRVGYRCFRYFPIALSGYWLAKFGIFAKLRYRVRPVMAFVALAMMVGIYFCRGWEYARIFDFVWAPLFGACVGVAFHFPFMRFPGRFLTSMGMKSMNIWFLHALFFTHSTKGLLDPLVDWIDWRPLFIIAVLALSYVMAVGVGWLQDFLSSLPKRVERLFPEQRTAN